MSKKILLIGANGYVGSAIHQHLLNIGLDVVGVDNFLRPTDTVNANIFETSYQNLDIHFLNEFTDCLWFAGHSSVSQSISDQYSALRNNFTDLIDFRSRFSGRLIYASSASVYHGSTTEQREEDNTSTPQNIYDFSKISFDNYLLASKNSDSIGLRMGTVNGVFTENRKHLNENCCYQRTRWELIVNAMVKNALIDGKIYLSNQSSYRSILSILDLLEVVEKIIISDFRRSIVNVCSFNISIGEIANYIAKKFSVELIHQNSSKPTYSFKMSNSLASTALSKSKWDALSDVVQNISFSLNKS